MHADVLILATLETKADEAAFLSDRLSSHGLTVALVDLSLMTGDVKLSGDSKQFAMKEAGSRALETVENEIAAGTKVVLGVGGGTGGEIALHVMRKLPVKFPKVLVTTLPFDPRDALSDSSIIIVPTLADICGLNATLRDVFETAAALTAGLCKSRRKADDGFESRSVGITALGATDGAIGPLVDALAERKQESTVFHANGFGGAAFARFARLGAFSHVIDLTPHELTRLHLAGAHVEMPDRFSAGSDLPRVVLPGALNFIGLGAKPYVPEKYLQRPHYAHSGFFTHAKVTDEEMEQLAQHLAHSLNSLSGPSALIIPMGGFSSQDRVGGEIEDVGLRHIFHNAITQHLSPDIPVSILDAHIEDILVTETILCTLDKLSQD